MGDPVTRGHRTTPAPVRRDDADSALATAATRAINATPATAIDTATGAGIDVLLCCADAERGASLGPALRGHVAHTGVNLRVDTVSPAALAAACVPASPDVLLLEHQSGAIGELGGVVQWLRQAGHRTRILALRAAITDAQQVALIRIGVFGAVLATDPVARIAKAIRSVHAGVPWFSRVMMYEALHHPTRIAVQAVPTEKLTPRESQVLELIGAGLSNKEIARRLGISDGTVKTHLHRVYVKFQQSGRYKAFLRRPGEDVPIEGAPWPHHPAVVAPLRVLSSGVDPLR